jgi:hypothetical protein
MPRLHFVDDLSRYAPATRDVALPGQPPWNQNRFAQQVSQRIDSLERAIAVLAADDPEQAGTSPTEVDKGPSRSYDRAITTAQINKKNRSFFTRGSADSEEVARKKAIAEALEKIADIEELEFFGGFGSGNGDGTTDAAVLTRMNHAHRQTWKRTA